MYRYLGNTSIKLSAIGQGTTRTGSYADSIEAKERALLAVLAGGQQVEMLVPDDRAGIAGAGNLRFPEDATFGAEFNWDILSVGDAGAVGPAEARPCLRAGGLD